MITTEERFNLLLAEFNNGYTDYDHGSHSYPNAHLVQELAAWKIAQMLLHGEIRAVFKHEFEAVDRMRKLGAFK